MTLITTTTMNPARSPMVPYDTVPSSCFSPEPWSHIARTGEVGPGQPTEPKPARIGGTDQTSTIEQTCARVICGVLYEQFSASISVECRCEFAAMSAKSGSQDSGRHGRFYTRKVGGSNPSSPTSGTRLTWAPCENSSFRFCATRTTHDRQADGSRRRRGRGSRRCRALELIDGVCAFPTCTRPAVDTDKDHQVPHPEGPTTGRTCGAFAEDITA